MKPKKPIVPVRKQLPQIPYGTVMNPKTNDLLPHLKVVPPNQLAINKAKKKR
jgi:hypothetical protein